MAKWMCCQLACCVLLSAAFLESHGWVEPPIWDDAGQKDSSGIFETISDPKALSIFWWNLNKFYLSDELPKVELDPKTKVSPLIANLRYIATVIQPDILLLGEVLETGLDTHTKKLLKTTYPFQETVSSMLQHPECKIAIYSKKQFSIFSKYLLWTPLDDTEQLDHTIPKYNYYTRRYVEISFTEGPHKDKTLVATHLLMPWEHMDHSTVIQTMVFGQQHPLYFQIQRLRKTLFERLGTDFQEKKKAVVVGDFNIAPSVQGLMPLSYELLSLGFHSTFDIDPSPTFPSYSQRRKWRKSLVQSWQYYYFVKDVQIDYALYTKPVQMLSARVLPLQGSDHYPLLMSIK